MLIAPAEIFPSAPPGSDLRNTALILATSSRGENGLTM